MNDKLTPHEKNRLEGMLNDKLATIQKILTEAMLIDEHTFISGTDYQTQNGQNRYMVVIRHGGEALKYDFLENNLKSIRYTSHFFTKGEQGRFWADLDKCAIKGELQAIYNILPYKEEQTLESEVYKEFRDLVKEHSPKDTRNNLPQIWCCDYEGNKDKYSFLLKNKEESFRIFCEDKCVVNIDYSTKQNGTLVTKEGISEEEINTLVKDSTLSQYCVNAILIIGSKDKYKCEYCLIGSEQTLEKTFHSEKDLRDFVDNLPASRYEVLFEGETTRLKDINFDIDVEEAEEEFENEMEGEMDERA